VKDFARWIGALIFAGIGLAWLLAPSSRVKRGD
jgi:hypothetical protein